MFIVANASRRCGEDHRIEIHLIANVLKVALGQSDAIDVFGTDYDTPDGTAVRDYIHVRDLAESHRFAVEQPVYRRNNLGTGKGTSVQEVINTCREVTGHPIPVNEFRRRFGGRATLVAANQHVKDFLGWSPKRTIQQAIQDAWCWHKSHPQGYQS